MDGYARSSLTGTARSLAFKSAGKVQLRSRNDNDMAARYPAIAKALARMPEDTVIDGEIVALDADGRPSFNLLQNYGNSTGPLVYFVFDILMLKGRDLKNETLETRRGLLERMVMPKLADPFAFPSARRRNEAADQSREGRRTGRIAPVHAKAMKSSASDSSRPSRRIKLWAALPKPNRQPAFSSPRQLDLP
jgi:hypothetical protein